MVSVLLYLLSVFTFFLIIGVVKTAANLRQTIAERDYLRVQLDALQLQTTYWQDIALQLKRHKLPTADATPLTDDPDWWKKGERFNGRNGRN